MLVLGFLFFGYNGLTVMIRFISKISPRQLTGIAIVRVDFNTADSWRMEAIIPTINYISRYADKIVLITHKGRPVAQHTSAGVPPDSSELTKFSVASDARKLSRLLKKKVLFIRYDNFSAIRKAIHGAPSGAIILLENIRFWRGEEDNNPSLARDIASVGDYFVNDAFAVSHRVAASVVGVPLYIPSFGGLLLEKELLHLGALLKKPAHPFIVIIGGGKAIDKLPVIKSLARTADLFLLAGASANTLYALQGGDIQDSLIDNSLSSSDISYFKKILVSKRVVMPVDYQWSNRKILDIGSRTASIFREHILSAKTILWSGPAGLFEKKKFATGSIAIARAILANRGAVSITGGGETVEFLKQYNLDKGFTFISTGGSALLRFLSRQKLPGIEVLKK